MVVNYELLIIINDDVIAATLWQQFKVGSFANSNQLINDALYFGNDIAQ